MGGVGEDIPNLERSEPVAEPNTDGIDLSPEGTDFSDCAPPAPPPPDVDLSAMEVAPAGTDVLDESQRNKPQPPPPATDHISLRD